VTSVDLSVESWAQLNSELSPEAVKDLLTHTPHVGSLERDRFEELVRLSETQTWLVRSSPLQLLGLLLTAVPIFSGSRSVIHNFSTSIELRWLPL